MRKDGVWGDGVGVGGSLLKIFWLHQKKLTEMLAWVHGSLPLGRTYPGNLGINKLQRRAISLHTVHGTRSMGVPRVGAVQYSCSTTIPTQLVSSQKWLRVICGMKIEVHRNFTRVFNVWIGMLHIYLQLSQAKKNSRPLAILCHKRKIMTVRHWNITFID